MSSTRNNEQRLAINRSNAHLEQIKTLKDTCRLETFAFAVTTIVCIFAIVVITTMTKVPQAPIQQECLVKLREGPFDISCFYDPCIDMDVSTNYDNYELCARWTLDLSIVNQTDQVVVAVGDKHTSFAFVGPDYYRDDFVNSTSVLCWIYPEPVTACNIFVQDSVADRQFLLKITSQEEQLTGLFWGIGSFSVIAWIFCLVKHKRHTRALEMRQQRELADSELEEMEGEPTVPLDPSLYDV